MKIMISALTLLGAATTFVSSALADVSINIRFGSSPSFNRIYNPYRVNTRKPVYFNNYPTRYNRTYQNGFNNGFQRNIGSRRVIHQVVPNYNYSNSWNQPILPRVNYLSQFPNQIHSIYSPFPSRPSTRYIRVR
ncbi:hypothetical protein [Pseudanabaena mucicola]|uniref:Uncharacterized protein n=1 Tax=Pseudanabaena mucicola FACHB-723 TaxID=2692860 RepID=A0ABR7ZSK0_9CYAN|nr:hypothetical protein [Pseudanabaena mucicola]MBD2186772.1 hypothetical protein [Pseudanabaena mucicola FACHB-723]